jgi:glycine oxidase
MNIGIAGGGLLGRLCGFHLSQAGHQVTIFEANASPAPAVNSIRAAAWTAAGMLSPIAEMECGGTVVRDLGKRSLVLWQAIDEQLRAALSWDSNDSPLGLRLHDSLMVCHASDMGSAQRVLRLLDQDDASMIKLNAPDVAPLAPALKGTLHAWRLLGEGHLYPHQAMDSFYQAMPSVEWRWGTSVHRIGPHTVQTSDETLGYDWVIDTRGVGAATELPVRGVRGELLVLSAPGFELHRPVRLLHPRWRVYIVPRPDQQIVVGATEIESEDRSAISVQSTMELLSAAFSIFPSLAEARILWSDVNLRPATPDNLPVIATEPGLSRINGLFRHGWLLGPAIVEKAMHDAGLH